MKSFTTIIKPGEKPSREKKKYSRTDRPWTIDYPTAQHLLSLMKALSDEESKGNAFSCVIISDAGVDPQKQDPTIATIIVYPDRAVALARPLSTEEKDKFPHTGALQSIPTPALETFAATTGLEMAHKVLGKQKNASILLICDALQTHEAIHSRNYRGISLDVRHPDKDDNASPEHKALHDTAHDVCRHARKNQARIDISMTREELEKIPRLKIFRE